MYFQLQSFLLENNILQGCIACLLWNFETIGPGPLSSLTSVGLRSTGFHGWCKWPWITFQIMTATRGLECQALRNQQKAAQTNRQTAAKPQLSSNMDFRNLQWFILVLLSDENMRPTTSGRRLTALFFLENHYHEKCWLLRFQLDSGPCLNNHSCLSRRMTLKLAGPEQLRLYSYLQQSLTWRIEQSLSIVITPLSSHIQRTGTGGVSWKPSAFP